MLMRVRGSTFQFLKYDVQMPALHDFTFCIWVTSSNFSHPHPLLSYSSELQEDFFNAFHTVVLKINLLETVKHNRYIGHRLQGVLYKIQQDDMFRST